MNRTGIGRTMRGRIAAGLAVAIVALLLSAGAWAQDAAKPDQAPKGGVTAAKILADTAAAYQALDTYKSDGKIVSNMEVNGRQMDTETTFTLLLEKPNLYLVTWSSPMGQAGAVWSDGTQPYLYVGLGSTKADKSYSKINSDDLALGAAVGISGGASFTIPSLVLNVFKDMPPLASRLTNAQREPDEKVSGQDCYVVSGASQISKKETYWITKSKHLIVKYARSLEPPEQVMTMPGVTDEQIEASIKARGEEVTPEKMESIRTLMKSAAESMKSANLKGTSIETQLDISTPKLSAADFKHSAPEGAVLKELPLGVGLRPDVPKPAPPAGGEAR